MDALCIAYGQLVMAIYNAYFDESYTDRSPHLMGVAGYVIRSDKAQDMDRKWRSVLKQNGLPYFHMVDCAHNAYPYNTLEKGRSVEIQTQLISLIKKYAAFGLAVIANERHYERAGGGRWGDPYAYCVGLCVSQMLSWVGAHHPGSKVSLFLESGHSAEAKASQAIADFQASSEYRSHSFVRKLDETLLQAGDILAWQSMKHLKDYLKRARPPRKDFISLVEDRHNITYVTGFDERDTHILVTDPGLNLRPGEQNRNLSVQEFMDFMTDFPDPHKFREYANYDDIG